MTLYKRTLTVFSILVYLVWTALFVSILFWTAENNRHLKEELATATARKTFNKDISFRRWVTRHGGVYVPITEDTQPNPYLKGVVDEQNITTPKGTNLTLMNPAYAIRQIMEQYEVRYGIKGRITSLKPLNPDNTPADWERKALEELEEVGSFDKEGSRESTEFIETGGTEYIRFFSPLYVESGCLKCHGAQGYEVGDLRGGISVSFPLDELVVIENERNNSSFLSLSIIWGIGIVLITIGVLKIKQDINIKNRDDETIMENLKEKEVLIKEVHHRVKNNLQIISSLIKLNLYNIDGTDGMIDTSVLVDTHNRIQTIAFIHEELYQSDNLKDINIREHINTLYNNLAQTYDNQGRITLDIDCEDIYFDVNTAIPLGLILNEVITNTFKYAYPDGKEGSLFVVLKKKGTTEYELRIGDYGVGIPDTVSLEKPKSLGLTLIHSLVSQLSGTLKIKTEKGTAYETTFFTSPEDHSGE